jgi:hypothetical protein
MKEERKSWFEECSCGCKTFKIECEPFGFYGVDHNFICSACGEYIGGVISDPFEEYKDYYCGNEKEEEYKYCEGCLFFFPDDKEKPCHHNPDNWDAKTCYTPDITQEELMYIRDILIPDSKYKSDIRTQVLIAVNKSVNHLKNGKFSVKYIAEQLNKEIYDGVCKRTVGTLLRNLGFEDIRNGDGIYFYYDKKLISRLNEEYNLPQLL